MIATSRVMATDTMTFINNYQDSLATYRLELVSKLSNLPNIAGSDILIYYLR